MVASQHRHIYQEVQEAKGNLNSTRGSPGATSSGHQEGARGCTKCKCDASVGAGASLGIPATPEMSTQSLSPSATADAHSANRRRAKPSGRDSS